MKKIICAILILSIVVINVTSNPINIKASSSYPFVEELRGVYNIVTHGKDTYGVIITACHRFANVPVHHGKNGHTVVACVRTQETPEPSDDTLHHYYFLN
jgi:hypothetical protein